MSDQYLLFANSHARTTDPATSKAAAASVDAQPMIDVLATLYERYSRIGFGGMTAEEAADAAGFDPWAVSKRVSDLIRQGIIAPTGRTRPGSSGRQQRELRWVPPEDRP